MRLNRFIAQATGMSRRAADDAIRQGRVLIDGQSAQLGQVAEATSQIQLDGKALKPPEAVVTLLLNKPVGYVCSRQGQGSKTIYDLLPAKYHHLKPVGRLDKDSSGLVLLTNDGQLAHQLTHPSFQKTKVYEVELDKPLSVQHKTQIRKGIALDDGVSAFKLVVSGERQAARNGRDADRVPLDAFRWRATLAEGRNRQIRRTFAALGYRVKTLHRTHFGPYALQQLPPASWEVV